MAKTRTRYARYAAFDKLSDQAQAIVVRGIEEDWTQPQIQEELLQETGERISNGALGRFVMNWRAQRAEEKEAQEAAQRIIEGMKNQDVTAMELGEAFVKQAMLDQLSLTGNRIDAETALKLNIRQLELRIKKAEVEQKDKRIELIERELALKETRIRQLEEQRKQIAERAKQVNDAARKLKDLSPEHKRLMREIYGLAQKEAA